MTLMMIGRGAAMREWLNALRCSPVSLAGG
jgi:hypothetical protein